MDLNLEMRTSIALGKTRYTATIYGLALQCCDKMLEWREATEKAKGFLWMYSSSL